MNRHIDALTKDSIRLTNANEPTNSFFGGLPSSSTKLDWPRNGEQPLCFIGQLDLAEINGTNLVDFLPSEGRLFFFYDTQEWPWGFDPKDQGGWAVLYENESGELTTIHPPKDLSDEHKVPNVKFLKADKFKSYPDLQRIDYEEANLNGDDDDNYYDFVDALFDGEPRHQMSGYPSPIQNDDMEEQCQLASGGVYCGNADGYRSELANQLRAAPNDWSLLLQFDSDDDIGAMWGDSGMLYFWIRQEHARQLKFDESWLILQCC